MGLPEGGHFFEGHLEHFGEFLHREFLGSHDAKQARFLFFFFPAFFAAFFSDGRFFFCIFFYIYTSFILHFLRKEERRWHGA